MWFPQKKKKKKRDACGVIPKKKKKKSFKWPLIFSYIQMLILNVKDLPIYSCIPLIMSATV
jgi:hypothetical protein